MKSYYCILNPNAPVRVHLIGYDLHSKMYVIMYKNGRTARTSPHYLAESII